MDERLTKNTFKKCDMHIHSSSCYSRDYDESSFFATVLSSGLDVVAITDHNNVDVRLLFDLDKQMSKNNKTLIGGVELNVRLKEETVKAYGLELGSEKKGDYFHAVVWFSIDSADEVGDIVRRLFTESILRSFENEEMSEEELDSLSLEDFAKLTDGVAVFLEDFQSQIARIPHFFIPHENKARSLSDYLPNGSQRNQEYKAKLFYYSHAMAVEGGEKSRKRISETLADNLNITVASLFFSDAKTLDEIGQRFTWIDFDKTLDSLLLAISDPESRIRTSDQNSELPQLNTAHFLESVSFNMRKNSITKDEKPVTLYFAPGYNGIVGSRGSGKTLLACILANKGLDTYSEYVDSDSIKFTTRGGIAARDRPPCLYLGQGELENIYANESYEAIPFLKEIVSPMRADAEQESTKAKNKLKEIIDAEKALLLSFCEKYEAGPRHLDHFDTDTPSGITLKEPERPSSSMRQIEQAKEQLISMRESAKKLKKDSSTISFKITYPEENNLFASLENQARSIEKDAHVLLERIEGFSSSLNKVEVSLFENREEIVTLFFNVLKEHNSSSDSTTLNQYETKTKEANNFYDDLLDLRIRLRCLDDDAKQEYQKILEPLSPASRTNAGEDITIHLQHDSPTEYANLISSLLNTNHDKGVDSLVWAFLRGAEEEEAYNIFDGRKFKSSKGRGLAAYLIKFFKLLKASTNESGKLNTYVEIDGKRIDDMSPGMKAQALLKLFLNDGVKSGDWMYIILDQPEDNLDVATIKEFLIDRLKDLKLNVQFFVVSHSAPIIVNGDARAVVVCSNQNDTISYSQGALNDETIKQSIADVLDGGERYLKMRLNKYNFQLGDSDDKKQ